jgi:ankyrin repeat protein
MLYLTALKALGALNLLLKRGANIDAKDHNGLSALDWAKKSGNDEIVRLLMPKTIIE